MLTAAVAAGTHLGVKGLKLLILGLTVLICRYKYERYLQTNKCPYCKSDVPDEADICPNCYKSQFQYEGISCGQAVGLAATIMLFAAVVLTVALF